MTKIPKLYKYFLRYCNNERNHHPVFDVNTGLSFGIKGCHTVNDKIRTKSVKMMIKF
jgi:hypothetical protein